MNKPIATDVLWIKDYGPALQLFSAPLGFYQAVICLVHMQPVNSVDYHLVLI